MKLKRLITQLATCLLLLSPYLVGCEVKKPPAASPSEASPSVLMATALDGSNNLAERRDTALRLTERDLDNLRSILLEHLHLHVGRTTNFWGDLHLLLNVGNDQTAKSLEEMVESPEFREFPGGLRAEMDRVATILHRAAIRDVNQDIKLTDNELIRLQRSTDPDELPPKNEWPEVLYKDKEGNIYAKPKGKKGRGFPTAYNINYK